MNKPVLVIMAAGMGSRYGGLKQMDSVGPAGELIIDYSLYDAKKAGFEKAVCIIKREIEEDFKALIERGAGRRMQVDYAFQKVEDVPEGFEIPAGRKKPWGTGHCILAIRNMIDSPFAVINADDYYGPEAFELAFKHLSQARDGEAYDYCMIGYRVENTISENGGVTRGVCRADGEYLERIHETPEISRRPDGVIRSTENGADSDIAEGTLVSMNFFGFTPSIIDELKERFPAALEKILRENPEKGEFYIPKVVGELVEERKAKVKILETSDRWFGVTYKEDRPGVAAAMRAKTDEGLYPEALWA
ncbi:MAG TPA: sugar phosphate nucleotidyltransferase [Bacillota bacterium]|nr:sugar phosphate nucleotidyltransferase [Bacillota bacterium]